MGKVIFILSVGHSGSTLLDITLGQFKNTFSTGELKHLTWQYYRQIINDPTKQECTCGKTFDQCEVWSKVIRDLAKYRQVKEEIVPRKIPVKHFDSLSFFTNYNKDKLLRFIYKWNLSNTFIPSLIFHNYFNKINDNNIQIFNSLFKINSEIEYIIDSSKDVIRYNELKHKIQPFSIILIRDIQQIKKSQYLKHVNKGNNSWLKYYNHQVLPMIKHLPNESFHVISYEMFVNNPNKILKELATKINIDLTDFNKTLSMNNYHLVAGNPIRYEEEIIIRQKEYSKDYVRANLEKAGLDKFYLQRI